MGSEFFLQQLVVITFSLVRLAPIFIASSLTPMARFPMLVRISFMVVVALLALEFNSLQFSEINQFTSFFKRLLRDRSFIYFDFIYSPK